MSARTILLTLALSAAPLAADDPATGVVEGRFEHRFVNQHRPAAVYVERIAGVEFDAPPEPARIDQRGQEFVPRVLPVLVGTEVQFGNSDTVRHNVKSAGGCQPFDVGDFGPGEVRSIVTESPGVMPISCGVHSAMASFVVVVETPYFAVTDAKGRFEIAGVPPGEYRLTFWHEKFEPVVATVRVEAGRRAEVVFRDLVPK